MGPSRPWRRAGENATSSVLNNDYLEHLPIVTEANPTERSASPKRPEAFVARETVLRSFLGRIALCVGLGWLSLLFFVEWRYRSADLPATMRASLCLAHGLGLAALSYSLFAKRIAAPLGLGIVALSTATIGLMGVALVLGIDPAAAIESAYVRVASPAWKPLELWQYDERYGYRPRPGASGRHEHLDFDVTYTLDEQGHRVTPTPKDSRGEILVTGCSFTFGFGLEDDETYSSLLAKGTWSDYKVVNAAAMGWGTAHALLTIEDRLQIEPPPGLIVYAMIPQHVERNYIRRSWLQNVLSHPAQRSQTGDPKLDRRGQPHFELENGQLVFQGVATLDDAIPDSPELYTKELEITCAILARMQAICRAANVPLVLLMLPVKQDAVWPTKIFETCGAHQIHYFDLSRLPITGFPHNQHPTAADNRQLAEAIAAASLTDLIAARRESSPAAPKERSKGSL